MLIEDFIATNPDPRELKRALVVKMRFEGFKHREIQTILGVESSYISRWEKRYREEGLTGIKLKYKGSAGYLNKEQREAVMNWLKQKTRINISELIDHVEQYYGVVYRSCQSYYNLFKNAGVSWRQKNRSPKYKSDECVVEQHN
ncbi:MAG: helix-turn-helix domain-containing protein [Trichodesmium sp. ALOHA_ZT_67]|nr:helix-turn-helix domain-containing protein [Trichodesmium sp. ALOHA_ZT_67]MDE5092973.1 helix-turn-helix domain-containing protein [Trichodesmium sp. St11_bin5]MDT9339138.1 helix-turn-helix domain-containing protein [Trichodesmium erythraeum 21-75]